MCEIRRLRGMWKNYEKFVLNEFGSGWGGVKLTIHYV